MSTPNFGLPSPLNNLKLWDHQLEALAKMRQYIAAFRKKPSKQAALVHMPTGSGKTRVIAALARYDRQVKCALLLAPRIALRDQLENKLNERFFKEGVDEPGDLPKTVLELEEKQLEDPNESFDSKIFVSTIQKLDRMSDTEPHLVEVLKKHVSLLIVDEGHLSRLFPGARQFASSRRPGFSSRQHHFEMTTNLSISTTTTFPATHFTKLSRNITYARWSLKSGSGSVIPTGLCATSLTFITCD